MEQIIAQRREAEEALRFAATVAHGGASPSEELARRAREVAADAGSLPGPLAQGLLEQLLLGPRVDEGLEWLQQAGLLAVLLPELEATVGFTQEMGRRHKDVWKHTKQVVAQSAPLPAVRWAALLHDVGKVPTRGSTPDGKVTFHGHPEVGARMFDRLTKRLPFPSALRTRVRFLILHHQRANSYASGWTDSAVRRFAREMGESLDELVLLARADITSARQEKRDQAARQIDELVERIRVIRELDAQRPPLPSGIGDVLMEKYALPPGRWIGDLKRELEAAIDRDELEPHQEASYYVEHLERTGRAEALRADAAKAPR
ncbi:MAG: HD domain-containing protein [Deltaproteobacteria bacterium]|nr:HD domain-containing protein [Deltaproteobacteria bacterium]